MWSRSKSKPTSYTRDIHKKKKGRENQIACQAIALSWRLFCSLVINVAPATATWTANHHLPLTAPPPALAPTPTPTWLHLHPPLPPRRRLSPPPPSSSADSDHLSVATTATATSTAQPQPASASSDTARSGCGTPSETANVRPARSWWSPLEPVTTATSTTSTWSVRRWWWWSSSRWCCPSMENVPGCPPGRATPPWAARRQAAPAQLRQRRRHGHDVAEPHAVGLGCARHTGHVEWARSQRSMQPPWKKCLHAGSTRTTSPSASSCRHTTHSTTTVVAPSLAAAAALLPPPPTSGDAPPRAPGTWTWERVDVVRAQPSSAARGSPPPPPACSWRHSDITDRPYRIAMYRITPTRTAMMMYSSVKLELAVPGTAEPPSPPPELGSDGGEDMAATKNTTRFQGHGNGKQKQYRSIKTKPNQPFDRSRRRGWLTWDLYVHTKAIVRDRSRHACFAHDRVFSVGSLAKLS